jgi:hypothetical protein
VAIAIIRVWRYCCRMIMPAFQSNGSTYFA